MSASPAFIESLKLAVEEPEARRNHLLLCASAMVPKALASLLTSAVVVSPLWKKVGGSGGVMGGGGEQGY